MAAAVAAGVRVSKRPAGAVLAAVEEATRSLPGRRLQVYRTVLDQIRSGSLRAGARLPSARQLALEWRVARGVVDEAFAQLQAEGLIERHVGDGSYVAAGVAPALQKADRGPTEAALRVQAHFAPHMAQLRRFELPRQQFHPPMLHPRAWPVQDFPLERWRRLMQMALAEEWRDHLGYGPAAGLPVLRAAIARHLAQTRALHCAAEQVIVVNGPLQAIETIARVLLTPGDTVWVEDPGHPSLPLLLEMLHCRAVGVPLDDDGFMVDAAIARAPDAVLAYLHPLTQYPLGIATSAARGNALLQWAARQGAWVVEGCFNDELVHRGPAPPTLLARDSAGRVLLMGTFEGLLFPSLRVGYLVVPERLADVFEAARGPLGDHTNVATQIALAAFIDEGHFNNHLRLLRKRCGERRDALRQAVRRWLPAPAILSRTDTGLHACLHLPPQWPDSAVVAALQQRRIGGEALSQRCWQVDDRNGLILAYGASSPAEIDAAVRGLGDVLDSFRTSAPG
jgi:GntR family transcriptional regulator/MocR family aminotransferase